MLIINLMNFRPNALSFEISDLAFGSSTSDCLEMEPGSEIKSSAEKLSLEFGAKFFFEL